jgi:uncharacterized membrane protein
MSETEKQINTDVSATDSMIKAGDSVPKESEAQYNIGEGGIQAIRAIIREETFSGPLPRPEVLKAYEEIQPGAVKTIMAWVTKEQDDQAKDTFRGKAYALIYGLAVCIVAMTGIIYGHPEAASIVMGLNVATVIGYMLIQGQKKD